MRVLYFHQHFSTPKGATGIRSYAMARKLIERGHAVSMVCGSYGGGSTGLTTEFKRGRREGEVDGIRVIEFDLAYSNLDGFLKRSWSFLKFALRSIKLAFSEEYDVLFATTTPLTAGIPGILARWIRGKPFIFEVRDLWPELPREMGVISNPIILGAMAGLEWSSYRSAMKLIGLSPGIVNGISRLGVDSDHISMIPNGCDLSIYSGEIKFWLPEGVTSKDLVCIYTGTHGIANGLDAVLDVAAELKKRNQNDVKFILIGQGKLKENLKERVRREKLESVIFLPPVGKEKLAGLVKSADIGLQILANVPAFYYGTSPNKFFDYIAAGLPVLNNYPGWLADMIEESQCGVVVPPDNAEVFADTLEQLATNRDKLEMMGINALSLAKNRFDRDDLSSDFVDVLEKVAK